MQPADICALWSVEDNAIKSTLSVRTIWQNRTSTRNKIYILSIIIYDVNKRSIILLCKRNEISFLYNSFAVCCTQALWAGKLSTGFGVASLQDFVRSGCAVSRLLSSSRSSSLSASPTSSRSSSSLPSSSSSSDGPGVEQRDTDGDTGADAVFCTRPNTIYSTTQPTQRLFNTFTQRCSVAKNVGCYQWRLSVCLFVCVCLSTR